MLAHRLRRWANIKTTLGRRLVFTWWITLMSRAQQGLKLLIHLF